MGLLYLGGPFEVLLGFSPPFSLTLLNPDRNRDQMGKRNKVCLDREVHHELGRGI